MKNTFLLDQYIALMECKLSIAKLHKEKRLAIRNNQFERAADLRAQQYEAKAQIENITSDAWNYFTQHLNSTDKQSERPNLYLIIDESTTTYPTNDKMSHNPKPESKSIEAPNPAVEAFKEHFAHEFNELTELYEKLQAEGKYQEAKMVLEMSLVVGEWLGR